MATHYQVLGVARDATVDDIRRAYRDRARALHPDRAEPGGRPAAARAMQEVNEAWRVLRDPARRAAYDRSLATAPAPRPPSARRPPRPWPFDPDVHPFDPDVDLDPRPYHPPVHHDDIGTQIVRSLPWVAGALVLLAIFVLTAVAGSGGEDADSPPPFDLVGECVAEQAGRLPRAVPCDEPNLGRVDLVASRASHCPSGSTALEVSAERWLCLRSADDAG